MKTTVNHQSSIHHPFDNNYRKIPKYSDTRKIAVIILKIKFYHRKIHPKIVDGMANSVDPDQLLL